MTNVAQEGMTAVDVQVHQTKGSEENNCENKTEGVTSVEVMYVKVKLVMKLLHYAKRKSKSQSQR